MTAMIPASAVAAPLFVVGPIPMLLGSLFLLIVGSGPWALDQRLSVRFEA